MVLTSPGYPGAYPTGLPIRGLPAPSNTAPIAVFHAGTKRDAGQVVTAGGRVLAVTAWAPSPSKREQKCIRRCRRFRSKVGTIGPISRIERCRAILIRHRIGPSHGTGSPVYRSIL